MTTSKAITTIYAIAEAEVGKEDAKKTISGIIYSVLNELEEAGAPVTEENFSKSLTFIAEGFLKAARRHVA